MRAASSGLCCLRGAGSRAAASQRTQACWASKLNSVTCCLTRRRMICPPRCCAAASGACRRSLLTACRWVLGAWGGASPAAGLSSSQAASQQQIPLRLTAVRLITALRLSEQVSLILGDSQTVPLAITHATTYGDVRAHAACLLGEPAERLRLWKRGSSRPLDAWDQQAVPGTSLRVHVAAPHAGEPMRRGACASQGGCWRAGAQPPLCALQTPPAPGAKQAWVKSLTGKSLSFMLSPNSTAYDLKMQIADREGERACGLNQFHPSIHLSSPPASLACHPAVLGTPLCPDRSTLQACGLSSSA